MNKLNYLLYFLGILSLAAYFPLLIFIGAIWKGGASGEYKQLFGYSILLGPLILGFTLIGIASWRFRKTKKFKLENQLEKSEKLSQIDAGDLVKLKIESVNYSSEEIEKMRKKVLKLQRRNLICGIGFAVLFFVGPIIFTPKNLGSSFSIIISLLIVVIYVTVTPNFNKEISKLRLIIKTWILEHKIKIPNISNLQFIPKNISEKLHSVFFISKMCQINSNLEVFGIDEVMAFEYKTKTIELIDFWIRSSSKNSKPHFYLCLTTTNPDQIEGQTVAWDDSNWHFKDEKLSHSIRTESPVFERIFKTFSSDPITARMHLNTSIMQDMIELQESFSKKNVVFYFDNSQIYIIFETVSNPLEIDINQPLEHFLDTNLKADIELSLKIFDEFCLSRKSGFYAIK